MNWFEELEEVLGRLRRHHTHVARLTLEQLMTLETTALVAAANQLRTTCDALVAQGRDDAAAAKAAAEAAVADAETAAQAAIDVSTKTLTDAEAELAPLILPPTTGQTGPGDPAASNAASGALSADTASGTAHVGTLDANGNQIEGAPTA